MIEGENLISPPLNPLEVEANQWISNHNGWINLLDIFPVCIALWSNFNIF